MEARMAKTCNWMSLLIWIREELLVSSISFLHIPLFNLLYLRQNDGVAWCNRRSLCNSDWGPGQKSSMRRMSFTSIGFETIPMLLNVVQVFSGRPNFLCNIFSHLDKTHFFLGKIWNLWKVKKLPYSRVFAKSVVNSSTAQWKR